MALVSMVTPPFEAQYAARSFIATSPSTEPIFTMVPPPALRNSLSAARDIRNGPFRFTVITRSQSSSLMVSTVETLSVPALFTSTLTLPNFLTVSATAWSASLARVTSQTSGNARMPCLVYFSGNVFHFFQTTTCYGHARAFPREGHRDGAANPRTAARDQSHFPCKSCHNSPLPNV